MISENDLIKLCAEWQETVGLKDWNIRIALTDPSGMTKIDEGNPLDKHYRPPYGVTFIDFELKIATIYINIDHPSYEYLQAFEVEKTLLHELMHIYIDWYNCFLKQSLRPVIARYTENVVESLAGAFYRMKYGHTESES